MGTIMYVLQQPILKTLRRSDDSLSALMSGHAGSEHEVLSVSVHVEKQTAGRQCDTMLPMPAPAATRQTIPSSV